MTYVYNSTRTYNMRLDECQNEESISEYCKNLPEERPEETYVEYSMCVWDYRTEDRSRMVMLMKVVVTVCEQINRGHGMFRILFHIYRGSELSGKRWS